MIPKIHNVLYTTDMSKNSAYAFRYAVNTARNHDAKIHLLHVMAPLAPQTMAQLRMLFPEEEVVQLSQTEDIRRQMERQIEERLKLFAERELIDDPETLKRIVGVHVIQGDPVTEILKQSDILACDIIIMGTHGKGTLSHTFLGSVSERVLRRTRKPVYIIPLPKEETTIDIIEL